MRTLFIVLGLLLAAPLSVFAGRLDIAVIQFNDKREEAEIAAALRGVDLAKITDSDRTESMVPGLRSGWVTFAQSLTVTPGSKFSSSTRLASQRADISGVLSGSKVSVQITILEGVKVGLRKYRQSSYAGSGSVAGGVPQLLSFTRRSGKTANSYGRILTYDYSTIVAACYTP